MQLLQRTNATLSIESLQAKRTRNRLDEQVKGGMQVQRRTEAAPCSTSAGVWPPKGLLPLDVCDIDFWPGLGSTTRACTRVPHTALSRAQ